MIAGGPGESPLIDLLPVDHSHVAQNHSSLCSEKGLVGASGHYKHTLRKRVLKLASGDEAQHMGSVIYYMYFVFITDIPEFMNGFGE